MRANSLFCVCLASLLPLANPAPAQNIVDASPPAIVLPERTLADEAIEGWVLSFSKPDYQTPDTPEAKRIAAKLDQHVRELIDGWPWKPFHHVLGISGYETYFGHPDQLFYSLSLALPFLSEPTRRSAGEFLAQRLQELPPYAASGFDRKAGGAREAYRVPEGLRRREPVQATGLFGITAFATYHMYAGYWHREVPISPHWEAISKSVEPLLAADPGSGKDPEHLNENLAGLIAYARLAKWQQDDTSYRRTIPRIAELAGARLNLERANPRVVTPVKSSSKSLHNFGVPRYWRMTAELPLIFNGEERKLATSRLRWLRESRNGWWITLGDRTIGGENYTNPLHFSDALFLGAALIERLPTEELLQWIDVPACKADLYFIEHCAVALGAGR